MDRMKIKEVYNDTFLVEIDKNVYEKLQDIYYFETIGKKQVLDNIEEMKKEIYNKTNITNIIIEDALHGYFIKYVVNDCKKEIFCYTLTEVVIHLKRLYTK